MIFRQSKQAKTGIDDLQALEQAVQQLPKVAPRPGLKHEMFAEIMREVRTPEPVKQKKIRKMPSLGFSMSLLAAACAIPLVFQALPDIRADKVDSTSGMLSPAEEMEKELAVQKADRERILMNQVIPHNNGQYIGEGVEIYITDQQAVAFNKGIFMGDIESNFDMYRLVQEIYNNGGQLVSINGILVEPYTQIVTRGALMEIRERRVQAPYVMKVIGDADTLYKKLKEKNSVLMQLQAEAGIETSVQRNSLVSIAMNND